MGFLTNLFNHANIRNVWNGVKRGVSTIYTPIKKVSKGISNISHFVDNMLDKAGQIGIPQSLIDLVRDNPIYSTVHDVIEFADDLVEKDIPRLGSAVENFVEHNILQSHAPGPSQAVTREVQEAGQQIAGRIAQRPSFGFTPNRGPSSRQNITSAA